MEHINNTKRSGNIRKSENKADRQLIETEIEEPET